VAICIAVFLYEYYKRQPRHVLGNIIHVITYTVARIWQDSFSLRFNC